jgi:predicted RNase H-like nuclease (RuvC/YqgF family)
MDEENKALQKFRNKLETWKIEDQYNDRIIQERNKIIGKLKQLESDITLWENNIGFFTKSKNSAALIHDFQNKIENGKQNIEMLNDKLDLIEEMENKR